MTKSPLPVLFLQLEARLREQELAMASLRASLDIQFKRIAHMQAELDLLPVARRRRYMLRALLADPPSRNGNHRRFS